MNRLFLKKLVLAFILGFAPALLLGLLDIFDNLAKSGTVDWGFLWSLVIGIVSGAIAAGIRALIATFTDIMPTDKLHGFGDNPQQVTVTKGS